MCKWLTSQTQIKPTCWRKSNDTLYSFANAFGLKSAYYTTSATNQNLLKKIQLFFFFLFFLEKIIANKKHTRFPLNCVKSDIWHMTCDMQHMRSDTGHVKCDTQGGMDIISNVRSLA